MKTFTYFYLTISPKDFDKIDRNFWFVRNIHKTRK